MTRATRWRLELGLLVTLILTGSCIPPADIPSLTTDELTLVISELIFDPEVSCEDLRSAFDVEYLQLAETPDELGLAYEEHWLPIDGEYLRVWYLPTALDRGTVVLSQGSLGILPCYLFHARILANNGWSVVMYEYRGIGESGGEPSIGGLREDLATVVDWARAHVEREQVTLFGLSLGAIPSVAVAVEHPEAINGVVLDSPVPVGGLIGRLEFALRSRAEDFIANLAPELATEELATQMHQPLLILVGAYDLLGTPASVQEIFDRAAGPKRLVEFPEILHAEAPFRDPGTYTFQVESFLSSVWGQCEPLKLEIRAQRGK